MAINTNFPYISPTPGEIMILAVTPYRIEEGGDYIHKEVFTRIIDCGFNAISIADSEENIKKCFSVLQGIDLSVIICDQGLSKDNDEEYDDEEEHNNKIEEQKQNTMIALINEFKNNPLLGGYQLKDEPRFAYLPTLKTFIDKIREVDTTHMIDVNLACFYEPGSKEELDIQGPYTDYQDYLDYFQQEFTPAVWSHDYYPIYQNFGTLEVQSGRFFKFMQMFYEMGKRTNRPIWAYCMCMPYVQSCVNDGLVNTCVLDGSKKGRPEPTEGELRFEAFSALAYGAQGIFYWAYTQRGPQPAGTEGHWQEYYTSAPITLLGKKTAIWYMVQKINKEIKKYNDVFCGCEVVNVVHAGTVYPGTDAFSAAFGYISNLEVRGEGVLVSHIRNKGYNYIVIVNHDPMNAQQIKLEFTDPDRVENLIDNGDEEEEPGFSPDDKDWIGLLAGGYLIYRIK